MRETLSEKIRRRSMNKTSDINLWTTHTQFTQVHTQLHICVHIHLSMSTETTKGSAGERWVGWHSLWRGSRAHLKWRLCSSGVSLKQVPSAQQRSPTRDFMSITSHLCSRPGPRASPWSLFLKLEMKAMVGTGCTKGGTV